MATWILTHFGSGPHIDTVLGDLAEEFVQNKSAMYYWRQTMKTIPVSFVREIRAHKRIAARALLTGWTAWFFAALLIFPVLFLGTNVGIDVTHSHPLDIIQGMFWTPVLGPASLHREGPWVTPFSYVLAVVLPLIVGTVSGWLVSRFHREHRTAVVLLFAGSVLLTNLFLVGPFTFRVGYRVLYIFAGPLAASAVASVLGILIGGGLLRHRSRQWKAVQ